LKVKKAAYPFNVTVPAQLGQSQMLTNDYRINGYTLIGAVIDCADTSVLNISVTFQCFNSVQVFIMAVSNDTNNYSVSGSVTLYYVKNNIIE